MMSPQPHTLIWVLVAAPHIRSRSPVLVAPCPWCYGDEPVPEHHGREHVHAHRTDCCGHVRVLVSVHKVDCLESGSFQLLDWCVPVWLSCWCFPSCHPFLVHLLSLPDCVCPQSVQAGVQIWRAARRGSKWEWLRKLIWTEICSRSSESGQCLAHFFVCLWLPSLSFTLLYSSKAGANSLSHGSEVVLA